MTAPTPEAWLRGPVPGISPALQPVAHSFLMTGEQIDEALVDLPPADLWTRPGGVASVGFHLIHLAGSTDRLLAYARGASLSEVQRAALRYERALSDPKPGLPALRAGWEATADTVMAQLAATPDGDLDDFRPVGRAGLPSTVRGLLFHAAEHAQRHAGQLVTTVKFLAHVAASGT